MGTFSACVDSSRRVPPISAFFSATVCRMRSCGPTWATVMGPESVMAAVSRSTGRVRSGSRATGVAKAGVTVTVRRLPSKPTSIFISSGITRPFEVPMA